MYGLIDCNNFYVSCERIFNPKLRDRPVVILSNNDGCIISRSNEAKALGIPMGAPAFQHRETFFRNNVVVISSNFALYGDMSERVMATLEEFGFPLDIYSVDEAFLDLPEEADLLLGQKIRSKVLQWTGIPISVGIASTKTLAKAASEKAKKEGVVQVKNPEEFLASFPVGEVWGIGPKTTAFLHECGIRFALDLVCRPDEWIKSHLSVAGLRTVLELRGVSCIPFAEVTPPRQGVVTSRSFGSDVTSFDDLREAVATFASTAAEKLREQGSVASYLTVFIIPKNRLAHSGCIQLPIATSHTPELISAAASILKSIFQPGTVYKKAGVMLGNLSSCSESQLDLFSSSKPSLMTLIDKINRKSGKKSIYFAAEGASHSWKASSSKRSLRFTTAWNEILTIK